ncbi:family 20 glycosylhydrolase [Mucilaginibacter sp. UC70_90]
MNFKAHYLTKLITLASFFIFLGQTNKVSAQVTTDDPHLGIIPAPASITKNTGTFTFSQRTAIKADNPKDKAVLWLKSYLQDTRHLNIKVAKYNSKLKAAKSRGLILTAKGANKLPAEGYKLTITPRNIIIVGKDAGLFYGIQTLLQLFPVENAATYKLPCAIVEDSPRFGYRGMMLDVSRHFFTIPQVKKVIELIAAYKLNTFHWHLVDGQGWRIEIKKYPKLTQVGAFRQQTMFGSNRDWPTRLATAASIRRNRSKMW